MTRGGGRRIKEEDWVRGKEEIRLRKHIGEMMSHGCGKVKLSEAERQNTAYHTLVINNSAVRDVYLCATWRRLPMSIKGFTFFFFCSPSYAFLLPEAMWLHKELSQVSFDVLHKPIGLYRPV